MPEPGEIHLYDVRQDGNLESLSDFERERYESNSQAASARMLLKSRSALRVIASTYTGKTPSSLELGFEEGGKPFFQCTPDLQFNLSHTKDRVFLAFSTNPVGIDIENAARRGDFQALAIRWFHPEEAARVVTAEGDGAEVFLHFWTAKEAMLKLAGQGIAAGLEKARVYGTGEGLLESKRIFLHRFTREGIVGAVAGFSPIKRVREAVF
jgi:4'-phosphopantetheinyl transferase